MNQKDSLHAFLKKGLGDRLMKACEVESQDLTLTLALKELGLNQRRIGVVTYTAVFWFFDFPWREIPPAMLPALVAVWLTEEGGAMREDLNLGNPVISYDPGENDRSITLTLEVDLYDEINMVQDEKGAISMGSKQWRLADPQIWIAQQIDTTVNLYSGNQ